MLRVHGQQTLAPEARTWRVRVWIRLSGVVVVGFLCLKQWDVVRQAGLGEMPQTEVRNGYVALVVLVVALFVLAFRPMLRIGASGGVHVRNPVGSRRFHIADVQDVSIDRWGLVISLAGGGVARSIVFQGTRTVEEPRWFDVAEALTGRRPEAAECDEEHCWDEDCES